MASAVTPVAPAPVAPAPAKQRGLAGTLVKLNFLLAKRQLGRSPWQIVGMVIGLLYLVAFGIGLLIGMAALSHADLALHRSVPILVFGTITVMWLLMALLFFGVDQTLDPARFSLMPLRARDLVPGLAIIGMLGVGALACLLGAVGLMIGWFSSPLVAVIALVAGVLGTLIGMLGARVLTTGFAGMLSSRRFKDLAAVLLFVLIMGFSVGMQFLSAGSRGAEQSPEKMLGMLHTSADVLAWTPFGWAWALPGDAAAGAWGLFAVRLVLTLLTVGVLWWAWGKLLERALTMPLESGTGAGKVKANSWVDRVFPATPAGAIGARTARYYRRDSRHLIGLISLVIMPFLMLLPMFINGEDAQVPMVAIAFAPAISAAFVGMSLMAELSYDGSAISTHILSGISGREDRLGRVYGTLLVLIPLLSVMLVIGIAVSGRPDLLPAILGLTVALACGGMGAGLVMDTFVNYPYPPPGSNPFAKNNGGGFAAMVGFLLLLIVTGVIAAPALAATIWQLLGGGMMAGLVALATGLVLGPLALWGLLVLAGRSLAQRWPEVLKNVTFEKN